MRPGHALRELRIVLDPESGEIVAGDVRVQTERVFRNLAAVLEAAGTSLERVLKCNVYLKSMDDFAAVNEVYATFFQVGDPPARATVEEATA